MTEASTEPVSGAEEPLTIKEAAAMIGCSRTMLYKLASERQITHRRIGRGIVFQREWVEAYLAETMIRAVPKNPAKGRKRGK